jgi:A/G-specific adenine glycosylase
MTDFAQRIIAWQQAHGRHDLPWQRTRDPYRIWLSEVMLQQTQVGTVIPYYRRFLDALPTVQALAQAPQEAVLALWSGLGYYSRARNLHAAARVVLADYAGVFPTDPQVLVQLPGIGRSTAAAIAVFSVDARAAILDGNVRRVFCRHDAIDEPPTRPAVLTRLWALAERRLPDEGLVAYTQGLMDLGASLCTRARPQCERCPLAGSCQGLASGRPTGFPAPRPRRETPLRDLAPLIVLSGDRVLLEQRPDQGVWGGLLSLPECPAPALDAAAVAAYAAGLLAQSAHCVAAGPACVVTKAPIRLPGFEHALTHFRFRITPWLLALTSDAVDLDQRFRWVKLVDCEAAALPQPIKRILRDLARLQA